MNSEIIRFWKMKEKRRVRTASGGESLEYEKANRMPHAIPITGCTAWANMGMTPATAAAKIAVAPTSISTEMASPEID